MNSFDTVLYQYLETGTKDILSCRYRSTPETEVHNLK